MIHKKNIKRTLWVKGRISYLKRGTNIGIISYFSESQQEVLYEARIFNCKRIRFTMSVKLQMEMLGG